MVKKLSVLLLATILVMQVFTLTAFASSIAADIQYDFDAGTVTVEVSGLPAGKDFSLMAFYDGDLDYLNQYTADENGNAGFSYPSRTEWANGGEIKILVNGVEFAKTINTSATVPVEGVSITGGTAINILNRNKTLKLTAVVTPENATDKSVVWKSSNPQVATVTDGVVKGVKSGMVTITATTVDGGFVSMVIVRVI